MNNINKRIAALPPDKQALLLQRLKQQASQPGADAPLACEVPQGWITRYQPQAHARLRLFCFSYAGAGASIFRQWAAALPAEIEVCCIQLPGREYRLGETAYTRMEPLIQGLEDAISPYLDIPFAFFGHSMGALVSFELARQLRKTRDRYPVRLYLAAHRAPHLPNPNIKIYHLPSEVFKVVLRAEGTPETILQNKELMEAMLPTLRADFELCDTYTYREDVPLGCPFSIYGGQEDVRISMTDLEAWRVHSSAICNLSFFPGAHFFLHSAQDLLLAELAQSLEAQLHLLESVRLVNNIRPKEECHAS